ncbi:lipopolysaccharide biosynthesis protein [Helcobacillus massiliensis]|uniref:lipopolysaccharide biosynthesis protein n=1 Tax=Helcobacillus massiliensis TaxID=521392 RepID=UPI0025530F4D|nr:lipopolysaccharide biosynthesis protein [Helcobacillus massiliensis]MDK7741877.1 lipopolysaccharide biosynthesis protein [Helcobacillus massiliensis]WOO92932.1 lipopolysaccharide biosynthesis protein [Helcobacillus massiliensis]
MASSLARSSARGGLHMLTGQGARLIVQMVGLVLLARLLGPQEYGLFAMAWTVMAFAAVFQDAGLSTAVIRARTVSRDQHTNLWWVNAAVGAALTVIVAAASPLVGMFFGSPDVAPVVACLGLTFLVSGTTAQHNAIATRDMRFALLASTGVIGAAVGLAVSIWLAVAGAGVWSLVAQMLVGALVSGLLLVVRIGWLPGLPQRGVPLKEFFDFGIPLLASRAVQYFSQNFDLALIGRFFGAVPLGYYSRSIQLVRMPLNQVRGPISNVALSSLAKNQDDDSRLVQFAVRGQMLLCYPIVLLGFGIAAAAEPIVLIMMGADWAPATDYIRLAAVGEALNTMAMTAGWIYTAKGASTSLLKYTVVSVAVRVVLYSIGAFALGPIGVAGGFALAPILLWPLSLVWAGKVTGVPTAELLTNSYRIFAVCSVVTVLTALVGALIHAHMVLELLAMVTVQLLGAGAAALVPAVRRDYRLSWDALSRAWR